MGGGLGKDMVTQVEAPGGQVEMPAILSQAVKARGWLEQRPGAKKTGSAELGPKGKETRGRAQEKAQQAMYVDAGDQGETQTGCLRPWPQSRVGCSVHIGT